jgi:ribosomal protein S18 acetylase RimI-like enzyme
MATMPTSTSASDNVTIQIANIEDIPMIKSMVDDAYSPYIERIGRPPAPMSEDWKLALQTHNVLMLRDSGRVVGSITFHDDDASDTLKIDNVVVHPMAQGHGYGRFMINHVELESQARGLSGVSLYTNAKMVENPALYKKLGFTETGRGVEDGFERVYFCKKLA